MPPNPPQPARFANPGRFLMSSGTGGAASGTGSAQATDGSTITWTTARNGTITAVGAAGRQMVIQPGRTASGSVSVLLAFWATGQGWYLTHENLFDETAGTASAKVAGDTSQVVLSLTLSGVTTGVVDAHGNFGATSFRWKGSINLSDDPLPVLSSGLAGAGFDNNAFIPQITEATYFSPMFRYIMRNSASDAETDEPISVFSWWRSHPILTGLLVIGAGATLGAGAALAEAAYAAWAASAAANTAAAVSAAAAADAAAAAAAAADAAAAAAAAADAAAAAAAAEAEAAAAAAAADAGDAAAAAAADAAAQSAANASLAAGTANTMQFQALLAQQISWLKVATAGLFGAIPAEIGLIPATDSDDSSVSIIDDDSSTTSDDGSNVSTSDDGSNVSTAGDGGDSGGGEGIDDHPPKQPLIGHLTGALRRALQAIRRPSSLMHK